MIKVEFYYNKEKYGYNKHWPAHLVTRPYLGDYVSDLDNSIILEIKKIIHKQNAIVNKNNSPFLNIGDGYLQIELG